ncbi:MAG TPA: BspA family leucine-rich repeat surface protein [Treponemataceae bacterium]|jgi:surface protein|nr:BspA family leucine-rich repeat surface protein [Treponemataceae bacterium]
MFKRLLLLVLCTFVLFGCQLDTLFRKKVTLYELQQMIENGEDVTKVDTSEITNMSLLFSNNTTFNQDISDWNVSNVTDMSWMFYGAADFNQDISSWKDLVNEDIFHNLFSAGSCPLTTANHPYESWNN